MMKMKREHIIAIVVASFFLLFVIFGIFRISRRGSVGAPTTVINNYVLHPTDRRHDLSNEKGLDDFKDQFYKDDSVLKDPVNYTDSGKDLLEDLILPDLHKEVRHDLPKILSKLQKEVNKDLPFGFDEIEVPRSNILEASYIQMIDDTKWRTTWINVKFLGEPGMDRGGPRKEWFSEISREIRAVKWHWDDNGSGRMHIHYNQHPTDDDLNRFRFYGKILAKAILTDNRVGIIFTRDIYKTLLDLPIEEGDMMYHEPDVYKSGQKMLSMPSEEIKRLDLEIIEDSNGNRYCKEFDLVSKGKSITVTKENIKEYVRLYRMTWMTKLCERQLAALKEGFRSIYPCNFLDKHKITPSELGLILGGTSDFNVEKWKANTNVYLPKGSREGDWFWVILEKKTNAWRRRLYEFNTGSCSPPVGGFTETMIINRLEPKGKGKTKKLFPEAQTCSKTLSIPECESQEELERILDYVVYNKIGFELE